MIKISNHYISKVISALLFAELLLLGASVYLGAGIRYVSDINLSSPNFDNSFASACIFALVMVFSMSAFGMYQHNLKEGYRNTILRLMPSLALGFFILTMVFYWLPEISIGRGVLVLAIIVAAVGVLLTRYLFINSSIFNLLKSRVIILGVSSLAKECNDLAVQIGHIGHYRYHIIGFVSMQDEEECRVPSSAILPVGESLLLTATKYNANEIIVAVKNRRNGNINATGKFKATVSPSIRKPIDELLECKLAGVEVIDAATFFEREAFQIRVDSLQPSWLVFGGGFDQSFLRTFSKRVFDLFASLILLLVTLPVMLITSLCIFLEDRTPILYRQERVGKDEKTFMVLKFRSMRNDAEIAGEPQWATTNDPRMTKVGRIIRKLRIDELPQILNVLKGEMSFVGPRPERPYFVKKLSEEITYYSVRHSVKPGISGLAQVRYQYGASVHDAIQKLQYDLYYVKNNSLFLDFLILVDTLRVVLTGHGAR